MGVSESKGHPILGCPCNKDPIWGARLGSPIFGNPHMLRCGVIKTYMPKRL